MEPFKFELWVLVHGARAGAYTGNLFRGEFLTFQGGVQPPFEAKSSLEFTVFTSPRGEGVARIRP